MIRLRLICTALLSLGIGGGIPEASAECGIASNYSTGRVTANGERFNPYAASAAHRRLPFGTKIAVFNRRTGRSIVVRINDRGPFVKGRMLDLTKGAARALGGGGLTPVCVRVLTYGGKIARLREAAFHGKAGLLLRAGPARD